MVGLSVVLESQQGGSGVNTKQPQVLNKATMNMITKPSTSSIQLPTPYSSFTSQTGSFLEQCFLCAQKLLPGKDIYMYKGDRAFCSVECRCKQMYMDEEESSLKKGHYCSLAAINPTCSSSASSSKTSSSGASRYR